MTASTAYKNVTPPSTLNTLTEEAVKNARPPFMPGDLAVGIAERIPEEDLRDTVIYLLPQYIRLVLQNARGRPGSGTSRFRKHRPDLGKAHIPYRVESGWKSLLDCTPDEIDYIAQKYEMRAEANGELAKRFRLLGDTMRYAKASVVGELPADVLDEFVEQLTGAVVDVANVTVDKVESA